MAVLTTALTRLRSDFDTRFPRRDKASDGWIGDAAHQASTSGHNPDDTPGSKAEYSDADAKAEVRAVDIDKDLKDTVSMQQVVDAILRTPTDRRRLKYVIFNRRIWSASNGWAPRAYTGSNPHDQHAHFSGDPAYDEDGQPWSSVLNIGRSTVEDDMQLTDTVRVGPDGSPRKRVTVEQALDDLVTLRDTLHTAPADLAAQGIAPAPGTVLDLLIRASVMPPGSVVITDEQLERVLRRVLGSVDGASPAA